MVTTTAGIREAKAHLSRYIKMVQQGNEILLTDRGRPVGKIVPVSPEDISLEARLRELTDKGIIEHRSSVAAEVSAPIPVKNDLASRYLQEDRSNG